MPPMIQPVHSLLRPILPVASVRFNPLQGTIPKVLKLFIEDIEQPLVVDKVMNHTRFG